MTVQAAPLLAAAVVSGTRSRHADTGAADFCAHVARLAIKSLYAELCLYPKPGLVSLVDNGSHTDMTASTFLRSLFALRRYFVHVTAAGRAAAPLSELKQLGIDAERRMLAATGGVNTHRGAIFCMGMLCAAIGACHATGRRLEPQQLRDMLAQRWGPALAVHARHATPASNGLKVALAHGVGGARGEAALGFPSVFEVALPALREALAAGRSRDAAGIDALYALMASIDDTNVYHRAGAEGAAFVRHSSMAFVQAGGTARAGWYDQALACHQAFVARKLSPGGAADLLAAAWLVYDACTSPAC